MANIIWEPQPQQVKFMQRSEYEALYGGAAGGGKSDSLLVEATRQVMIPHYKGIIFRKTFPQLADLIDRSYELYKHSFPRAVYNTSGHYWTFPSGAKIYFGNMQRVQDRTKYQGRRFDFVAFDELTHFTWEEYSYMYSRNRPGGPGTRVYMRATANPGGIGHGWVKNHFITAAKPMTTIKQKLSVVDPEGKLVEMERNRIFVPATVFDNKKLLQNDPNYLANLALLSEKDRNALLYGDWDSFSGQVFTEWRNDPQGYETQRFTHVIKPFNIPSHWRIYRGYDFGYAKPFSFGWYAVSEDNTIYRIAEYYGCTGAPNEGLKIEAQQQAREAKRIEREHPLLKGKRILGIADPAIFDKSRGDSIGEIMEKEGLYFEPGDHTRIPGKMQFHNRFAFDEEGKAMLYIFNTCNHFIRTIPSLVYSQTHVEDIDTSQEDHIYDECRYVLMAHPVGPRKNVLAEPMKYNPLDTEPVIQYDKFYRV